MPSAAGPALQGRCEVCGVLQAVKMMATMTNMQPVHSFPPNLFCSWAWRVYVLFLFFSNITIGLSVICCMGVCIFLFVVVFNGCKRSKKQNKQKKSSAKFKTGSRNFKASLSFGWESSCPDSLKLIKQNRRTTKLQKHAGSSLEAKIDTVLNAPGRVQPQIDSLT